MLDLRPEWLTTVRQLFAETVPDAEVLAFGSRVNGTAHEASDLDLVIRYPENPDQPNPHLSNLREALEKSRLPILVDILDWTGIPEEFRVEILKGKVDVVQAGEND